MERFSYDQSGSAIGSGDGRTHDSDTSSMSGLERIASRFGLDPDKVGSMRDSVKNVNVGKVRDYARANPGKSLGILSAIAIGAGLLASKRNR